MDEKGNDGIGMEDEPETSEGDREVADRSAKNIPLAEKLTDTGQNKGGRQYTDVPAARVSLKEKLEAFKVKAAEGDADKATPKKQRIKQKFYNYFERVAVKAAVSIKQTGGRKRTYISKIKRGRMFITVILPLFHQA